jgi:hypothetical protein
MQEIQFQKVILVICWGIRRRTAQKITGVTSWGTTARMIKEVLLIHVRSVFQRWSYKTAGQT